MNIAPAYSMSPLDFGQAASSPDASRLNSASKNEPALREAFDSFVGETFYGQMLSAMRKSVGKAPYFHGGRAEETFRGQLDQMLSKEMTKSNAGELTGNLFEQFKLTQLARQ